MTKLLGTAAKPHRPAVDTMLIGEAAVHLYRPGGQDSRHAVEPHARTVTADGYLKSMGARLPRIPPQLSASA